MDLFDQIISQELKESGLIYGGSKKSHFTLSLINDGSGKFHADRVKISPGRAGNTEMLEKAVTQLGYRCERSAAGIVVFNKKARTKVRA